MIRLQNDIKKFTHIFHIGDIHIRLTKRHDEYDEAFKKLYAAADNTPESTLIYVAGDVFHNKADLSAEAVEIVSNLLKTLADKRPTILIAGNHDAMLNNKNRLDSLTPVVNAIHHPNLYYLKESEIYIIGDVLFNNYSVFTDADKYIKYADIPSKYKNETNYTIALYHGPVLNAITDIGYTINNRTITSDTFDGHQMVMLGDIHKHQTLQQYDDSNAITKPIIAYCGSLIQQDFGEELLGHGYLLWDLKTKSFTHTEIQNDYGMFTVDVNNGKLITDITNIPAKATIRMKCFECVPSEIKSVLTEIKKVSNITDVKYIRMESESDDKNILDTTKLNLQNLSDVSYQNQLIKEYFENKKIKLEDSVIEGIYSLNKDTNALLKKEQVIRNIRWKPKKLEFDNMFSYGDGNVIDFTKMGGTMGLFARNAHGKSSINSILTYCLFDKCERTGKAGNIMNIEKMSFRCKFNFEINGTDFFIERIGKADKKGAVKVEVKFWKLDGDKEVDLKGDARQGTNEVIRNYIGSYDDFILTALSIQNGKDESFSDMGNTKRKDLLTRFMGINIFDNLHDIASSKSKEIDILLKDVSSIDYNDELINTQTRITETKTSIQNVTAEIQEIEFNKESKNNELLEFTKKLIQIDCGLLDIVELETKKNAATEYITLNYNKRQLQITSIEQYNKDITELDVKIKEIEDKKLAENIVKCNELSTQGSLLKSDINLRKNEIKNKNDKLEKLKEHKYDPTCEYCINSVFVKDAIATKEKLVKDEADLAPLLIKYAELENECKSLQWVVEEKKKYDYYITEKQGKSNKLSAAENEVLKLQQNELRGQNELDKVNIQIDNFYKQKDNIEYNKSINVKIDELKQIIKNIDGELKNKNKILSEFNNKLQTLLSQKDTITKNIERIANLELKKEWYKNYIEAIHRDGIPYDLITHALPSIEKEVNTILHQIVDFTVRLKTTDNKDISTYIVYDDKSWQLELSSGMERFISSLAIRVALINISNLPRSTFMVIDEGFSALDVENIQTMSTLFSFLKTQFDFLIIISHLDVMKDMVDKQIEIKKENGFSHVAFE